MGPPLGFTVPSREVCQLVWSWADNMNICSWEKLSMDHVSWDLHTKHMTARWPQNTWNEIVIQGCPRLQHPSSREDTLLYLSPDSSSPCFSLGSSSSSRSCLWEAEPDHVGRHTSSCSPILSDVGSGKATVRRAHYGLHPEWTERIRHAAWALYADAAQRREI